MNREDRASFALLFVLAGFLLVLPFAPKRPVTVQLHDTTLIVVGQPAEHLRVAVPRSTFVACVEGLDPDALDLRQRIVQCAGIEHGRGP